MEELTDGDNNYCIYKDVVIIGNGPGGICLSYMLNGNWPYYTGQPHPTDEMLTARLNYIVEKIKDNYIRPSEQPQPSTHGPRAKRRSLLEASREDLEVLTNGLEGRGTSKPMALLLDQLQHPAVDAGFEIPSLLTWESVEHHREHKVIDHVVLGKGPPGGAWQFMDPNVLTISLTRWMSLPGLDLRKWQRLIKTEHLHKSAIYCDRISDNWSIGENISSSEIENRIPVGTVAAYYKDYVTRMGLTKYFKGGRTVTAVRPLDKQDDADEDYKWIVQGYENQSGRRFKYKCKKVVLATGTTNSSNRLGVPGEESQPTWVTHDLNDLESRMDRLAGKCTKCSIFTSKESKPDVDPVLVIGAGLSAADAIIAARFRSIPVIHAFRDTLSTSERLKSLPVSMYPEYHKVYEMMTDGRNHRLYRPLAGYNLIDLGVRGDCNKKRERRVLLRGPAGQIFGFRVSVVAILIGSKPDLTYLGDLAMNLGKYDGKIIDGRSNPIDTDEITYEVLKSPKRGLHAIGPLVGDNFVRFIVGGAFGTVNHILNTLKND